MARPEKPIDWKLVDDLLMAGCKGTEISPYFDMHVNTFYRKVLEIHNISFNEYSASKKEQGDSVLRAKQYEKAVIKGDTTMLIWLGKSRLGQIEAKPIENIPPNDAHNDIAIQLIKILGENQTLKEKILELESKTDPVVQPSDETV